MLKQTEYKTVTYDAENGFFVDISRDKDNSEWVEIYLYHKDDGIKMLMWGEKLDDYTLDRVNANLDEYIEIYKKEYNY